MIECPAGTATSLMYVSLLHRIPIDIQPDSGQTYQLPTSDSFPHILEHPRLRPDRSGWDQVVSVSQVRGQCWIY